MEFDQFRFRVCCQETVDMRKGILYFRSAVNLLLQMDPYDSDYIYLFINKRHNLVKAYSFDGENPWLLQMHKASGTLKWDSWCKQTATFLTPEEVQSLLAGNYPSGR